MSDQQQYLTRLIAKLQLNPTGQDIDYLVEAYARVGYLAAEAEGLAEQAEAVRKHREAEEYLHAKQSGEKVTDKMAETLALSFTKEERDAEVEARTKARKLKNLLNSIEQAINAIKFLGRQGG